MDWSREELVELPKIRTNGRWLSEKVRWRSTLSVQIVDVETLDAECDRIDVDETGEETMECVCWSETSHTKLRVTQEKNDVAAETLVNALMGDQRVDIEVESRVTSLDSDLFSINIELTNEGWLVEPASFEALDELGNSLLDEPIQVDRNHRQLRLGQGVGADVPVTIRFRMYNESPEAELRLGQLAPFHFSGVGSESSWIYVRSSSGVQLSFDGAENTQWLSPQSPLPVWIAARVAEINGVTDSRTPMRFLRRPSWQTICFAESLIEQHEPPSRVRRSHLSYDPAR